MSSPPSPPSPPLIRVFYHVCAVGPLWESIVRDQLTKVVFSGLYDAMASFHCYVCGPEAAAAAALVAQYGDKFRVERVAPDDATYERLTILSIPSHVRPGDKILYFHTKGVTKPDNGHVYYWRALMEYHLIARWRECVALLDASVAVGCNYSDGPSPHFSGNFWWCTADYFLELPRHIDDDYYAPEFYVLSALGGRPPAVIAHTCGFHHYLYDFYPRLYVGKVGKV